MTTQKLKGTLYEDQAALQRFRDFEHRYYQEVTIAGVMGECPFGHREGEKYKVANCNSDGLCGALYTRIHALDPDPPLLGQPAMGKGSGPVR